MGFFKSVFKNVRNAAANVTVLLYLTSDALAEPTFYFRVDGLDIHEKYQKVRDFLLLIRLQAAPVTSPITEDKMKSLGWAGVFKATLETLDSLKVGSPQQDEARELVESGLCFLVENAFTDYKDGDDIAIRLHDDGQLELLKSNPNTWKTGRVIIGNFREQERLVEQLGLKM